MIPAGGRPDRRRVPGGRGIVPGVQGPGVPPRSVSRRGIIDRRTVWSIEGGNDPGDSGSGMQTDRSGWPIAPRASAEERLRPARVDGHGIDRVDGPLPGGRGGIDGLALEVQTGSLAVASHVVRVRGTGDRPPGGLVRQVGRVGTAPALVEDALMIEDLRSIGPEAEAGGSDQRSRPISLMGMSRPVGGCGKPRGGISRDDASPAGP